MTKERITDQKLTELFEEFLNNCDTMSEDDFRSDVISAIAEDILNH